MPTTATPIKLRSGAWGAKTAIPVKAGETVEIRAKSGKTWTARVSRVVWTDGRISLCATESLDSHGNSVRSGASYQAGVTAPYGRRCDRCGSRECARAWNPRDLCDDD